MDEKAVDEKALLQEALQALERKDAAEAMRLGEQLIECDYVFGYEVTARAHYLRDEREEAIEVLEEGVLNAKKAWTLWHLLATYHARAGHYERAYECYERALDCDNAPLAVHYNYAADLVMTKRYEEALAHLEYVTEEKHAMAVAVTRTDALLALGRYPELLQVARGAMKLPRETAQDRIWLTEVMVNLGFAFYAVSDNEDAIESAIIAVRMWPMHKRAMLLIRLADDLRSPDAKRMRVFVYGLWTDEVAYQLDFEAVAESGEEAIRFLDRFEPDQTHGTFLLERVEILADAPDERKGIYSIGSRRFYDDRNADA